MAVSLSEMMAAAEDLAQGGCPQEALADPLAAQVLAPSCEPELDSEGIPHPTVAVVTYHLASPVYTAGERGFRDRQTHVPQSVQEAPKADLLLLHGLYLLGWAS